MILLWAAATVTVALALAALAATLVKPKDDGPTLEEKDIQELTRPTGSVTVVKDGAASGRQPSAQMAPRPDAPLDT